jgi:hypothetical protein
MRTNGSATMQLLFVGLWQISRLIHSFQQVIATGNSIGVHLSLPIFDVNLGSYRTSLSQQTDRRILGKRQGL